MSAHFQKREMALIGGILARAAQPALLMGKTLSKQITSSTFQEQYLRRIDQAPKHCSFQCRGSCCCVPLVGLVVCFLRITSSGHSLWQHISRLETGMVKRKSEEVNVKPRTKRARRILEKREPKLVTFLARLLMLS